MEIAEALVRAGITISRHKKVGRFSKNTSSSSENSIDSSPSPRRLSAEIRPSATLKYDTLDHLPTFNDKKEATRCKLCKTGKTYIYCVKCKVHLC